MFRCGEGCVLEACSTSSSSRSSRPSSCNRFVLNRIQKDPEGTSSLGAACFWRSFRPSVAWCFGVARGTFWKPAAPEQQQRQQQQQAQQLNSLCFYQNPEGTSSLGTAGFWRSFRPSGPWCFAVSQPPARTSLWSCFEGMEAALWSWFLVGSEGNVRHWGPLPAGAFRPSGPWCCAVSQPR